MIDIKDLQIGDWVFDGDEAARITSLTCDGIIETTRRISNIEVVAPIPLTPEILEKNGFKKYGDTGWWLEDDYYDVQIYEWSDSIWVARYESNEMNCPHEQLTMSYIYELQHFLKAVGIEKEITI